MKKYISAITFVLLLFCCFCVQAQSKTAGKRYDRREYAKAIPLYLRHLEKAPTNVESMQRLAHCYRLVNDWRNAEYWYGRLAKAGVKDLKDYFYFGQALVINEKWDEAIPWLEKYLQQRDWDDVAQNLLRSAQDYKRYMNDSVRYVLRTTNVNTPRSDFAPTLYRNNIVFCSSRKSEKFIFNWTGDNFLDLYQAQYTGKSELGEPVSLPGRANSKYHEGGSTFNSNGNLMFFTRNDYNQGRLRKEDGGVVRLKTYQAELIRNKWRKVTEAPFNGKGYSVGHPSLSQDGQTLYFVSDMPGGEGGADIWYVTKNGLFWSSPKNLGARVNTPGNELFPWISPTGILYFASNGHPGLGGLDLYRVTSLGGDFEKVQNMGYPLNTPKDDFGLVIDENSGIGFFSSNRPGGKGDDDIYSFVQRQVLEGLVVDKQSGIAMGQVKVEIYGANGLIGTVRTNDEGIFRFGLDRNTDYLLVANAEHHLETRQKVSTMSFDPAVPVEVILNMENDNKLNLFNLSGKVDASPGSEVAGATVRIVAKEVVVQVDETGKFQYILSPDTDYEVRIEKEGYLDEVFQLSTKGRNPGEMNLNLILRQLAPDTALYRVYYELNDAQVRGRSADELDRVVDFLRRNPNTVLKIVSRADPRGSDVFNENLSKKRSEAAYTYLIQKGVPKEQLELLWVGEKNPVNKCKDGIDCTEEELRQNRQTELRYGGKSRRK